MHNELWLAECYVKSAAGDTGWDIVFAWIIAPDCRIARELAKRNVPRFDEIITISGHSHITPLSARTIYVIASEFLCNLGQ